MRKDTSPPLPSPALPCPWQLDVDPLISSVPNQPQVLSAEGSLVNGSATVTGCTFRNNTVATVDSSAYNAGALIMGG
jgi:hypothetical protein